MADLVKVEHANGDVSVGFDADGVFVPVASVQAHRIAQVQERAKNLSELLESDDPEQVKLAQAAVAQSPISSKPVKAKASEE